jgi:hypothetical protein
VLPSLVINRIWISQCLYEVATEFVAPVASATDMGKVGESHYVSSSAASLGGTTLECSR